MTSKLRPKQYAGLIKFKRTIDFRELNKWTRELLSKKKADQLTHDLAELDEACESFRRDLKTFLRSLKDVRNDSTNLYDAAPDLISNFYEFRLHMRQAQPTLEKLHTLARGLPPVVGVTDDELVERDLAPFDRFLKGGTAKATGTKKKKRPKSKATKAKSTKHHKK